MRSVTVATRGEIRLRGDARDEKRAEKHNAANGDVSASLPCPCVCTQCYCRRWGINASLSDCAGGEGSGGVSDEGGPAVGGDDSWGAGGEGNCAAGDGGSRGGGDIRDKSLFSSSTEEFRFLSGSCERDRKVLQYNGVSIHINARRST